MGPRSVHQNELNAQVQQGNGSRPLKRRSCTTVRKRNALFIQITCYETFEHQNKPNTELAAITIEMNLMNSLTTKHPC